MATAALAAPAPLAPLMTPRRLRSIDRTAADVRQRLAPFLDQAAPTPADEAPAPDVPLVEDVDEEGNPRAVLAEGARRGLRTPKGGR